VKGEITMTYNWNTMEEITVPTGTNGWLYSGEVIINGVKVRFPVGVPTSVPEPAAVLLKKMIELEQEEDANTAKPQNHYVGDVTIPAGKTLTLEKGAKFVDNSGPSEVVILPETELERFEYEGQVGFILPTPFINNPEFDKTYTVTYNGDVYDCKAFDFFHEGPEPIVIGNTGLVGVESATNEPFLIMLYPSGKFDAPSPDITGYGTCMANPVPESITLSIVEKAETASAGGGGMFIVNCPTLDMENGTATFDKTFEEVLAAYNAGRYVVFRSKPGNGELTLPVSSLLTANGNPSAILAQGILEVSIFAIVMRASGEGTLQIIPLIE